MIINSLKKILTALAITACMCSTAQAARFSTSFGLYIAPQPYYSEVYYAPVYYPEPYYVYANTRHCNHYHHCVKKSVAPSPYRAKIMRVQRRLTNLGYYNGGIDGLIGSGTRNAVRSFQMDNGISPTGAINDATLQSLGIISKKYIAR